MSTILSHPDIDVKGNRKQLNAVILAEIPAVLNHMENLKAIIEDQLAAYDENERKKKIEKARLQLKLKEKEEAKKKALIDFPHDIPPPYSSSSSSSSSSHEDKSYLETLTALQRLKAQQNESVVPDRSSRSGTIVTYPSIPERTVSLDYRNSAPAGLPHSPPPVPPKDYDLLDGYSETSQNNTRATPPLDISKPTPTSTIEHKSRYSTEGGSPLRTTFLPGRLREKFLQIANNNTLSNLETCGILCGKLNRNAFFINYLVIPDQESTSDTCSTTNEENLFEFIDQNELFILGWIHTHPTQTCFLSSIDLHTQNSYQIMLPEAVAIVCSPKHDPSYGIFRLTDPSGINVIKKCSLSSTFHPHREPDLYKTAYDPGHIVMRDDLPFKTKDLRE